MKIARRVCRAVVTATLFAGPSIANARVAPAQALGGGSDLDVSLGRIVMSLLVCVAIAILAIMLVRNRGGSLRAIAERASRRTLRRIDVVETRRLSVHADLSLVRWNGREYLLLLQQGASRIVGEQDVEPSGSDPCA